MLSLFHNPVFLVFGSITVVSVIGSIMHYMAKIRKEEMDAALKQEMIQKGMSAEDIHRVLVSPGEVRVRHRSS